MPDQIQDKGFKRVFKSKKYFFEFLGRYVQGNLAHDINMSHLSLENTQSEDSWLRRLESDIVYHLKNEQQDIYFYICLELQSKNDFTMPFRMLLYLTDRMRIKFDQDKEIRQQKDYRIPAVIPIVFYSGRSPWTAEQRFRSYTYNGDRYGDNIIDFKYELVSLRDLPADLVENGSTGLDAILAFARNILVGNIHRAFDVLTYMVKKIISSDWPDIYCFIKDVYGDRVSGANSEARMCEIFEKGDVERMEAALDDVKKMVLEQELKKLEEGIEVGKREGIEVGKREGIEVGIKEGEIRAKREMARRMLHSNLQMEMIMEVTGLSASEIEELKNE